MRIRSLPLLALLLASCSSNGVGGSPAAAGGDDAAGNDDASSLPPGAGQDAASRQDANEGATDSGSSAQPDAGTQGSDAGACPGCARDWTQFPPIVQLDSVPELWVMSDVHADYGSLTTLLTAAHIIPAAPSSPQQVQWSAGQAALVVVGDLIDKGPDAPDVVRLMASLRTAAAAAGGHVVVTMGNHEAEFLANPQNSKATSSDGIDPQLQAIGLTPQQTAAGQDDIGAFIRDLPFAARVDDWFFVHAGNTGGQTIAQLASALQSGVDSGGFGATVLSDPNSLLEARLSSSGPQWWDATNDAATLLGQWTQALGAKHLVMGHQPGAVGFADGTSRPKTQMFQYYGGLIFLVDTGLSVDVDATGGALAHVQNPGTANESWTEVLPNGSTQSF